MAKRNRAQAKAQAAAATANAAPPSRWLLDPARDLGLMVAAPIWIAPAVFIVAGALGDRAVNDWVMALGSIGHHLPGMMRAYGDRALYRRFRARFVVAPLALAAACVGCSLAGLHAILYVAFGWGVWHGMMQTYGFARIYGAKAGAGDRLTARLDFALLATWFGAAVVWSPYRLTFLLDGAAACGLPLPSLQAVRAFQLCIAATTAAATLAWLAGLARAWRSGRAPDGIRVLLLATSIGFWCFANVRVRHPLLGMPLFEVFHDAQYLAIVWLFNRRRADSPSSELRPLLRAMFRPGLIAVVVYVAAVAGYGALGLAQSAGALGDAWNGLLAASQLLHFYYDGFIWKVREPQTGAALGVARTAAAAVSPTARAPIGRHALLWSFGAVAALALGVGEARGGRPTAERILPLADLVPDNTLVQFAAAETRWQHGDRARAVDGFRRAVALDPDYAPAKNNLALSLGALADEAAAANDPAAFARFSDELGRLRPRLDGEIGDWADRKLASYK